MEDKNENYAFQSQDKKPSDEKVIVRTFDAPQTETFTIKQLKEKIARIEEQKLNLDKEIAKIQEKIDEANTALAPKK